MDTGASLKQAISAIKSGDKVTGQRLLLAFLKENPDNETAILWLSATTDDPARKRQCFERVLRINPDNEAARRGLAQLEKTTSPETPSPQPPPPNKKSRAWLIFLGIILLVCCILPLGYSILNYSAQELGLVPPTSRPARSLTPTRPFVRSATRTPTPAPTRIPTINPVIAKARWGNVDIRDLVKNPDGHLGDEVHYKGEVFTIEESSEGTAMQVWVDIPGGDEFDREAVVILFQGNTDPIYEGTKVEFWGYCTGAIEGVNAFGGTVRQPSVLVEYLTYFH